MLHRLLKAEKTLVTGLNIRRSFSFSKRDFVMKKIVRSMKLQTIKLRSFHWNIRRKETSSKWNRKICYGLQKDESTPQHSLTIGIEYYFIFGGIVKELFIMRPRIVLILIPTVKNWIVRIRTLYKLLINKNLTIRPISDCRKDKNILICLGGSTASSIFPRHCILRLRSLEHFFKETTNDSKLFFINCKKINRTDTCVTPCILMKMSCVMKTIFIRNHLIVWKLLLNLWCYEKI